MRRWLVEAFDGVASSLEQRSFPGLTLKLLGLLGLQRAEVTQRVQGEGPVRVGITWNPQG